jgi:hypothetical protein
MMISVKKCRMLGVRRRIHSWRTREYSSFGLVQKWSGMGSEGRTGS